MKLRALEKAMENMARQAHNGQNALKELYANVQNNLALAKHP